MDPMEVEMEITNQLVSNEKVINLLKRQFENLLDLEIIESVAFECEYDMNKAVNHLSDISKDITHQSDTGVLINIDESNYFPQKNNEATEDPKPSNPEEKKNETMFAPNLEYHVKSLAERNVKRIIADGKRGIRIMILLRGLPGSGKSFLADRIIQETLGPCDTRYFILSADDFFHSTGTYIYNAAKINDAHKWNQSRAQSLLRQGVSPIIIDNTNTQVWEMKPYCMWAVENSYAIEILEPDTRWAFNEKQLAHKNIHNVPRAKIRDMLERYEEGVTVEMLFDRFNLCYRKKLPPQPRVYPKIPIKEHKVLNSKFNQMNQGSKIEQMLMQPLEEEGMQNWNVLEPLPVNTMQTNPFLNDCIEERKDSATMTTYSDLNNPFTILSEKVVTANGDFVSAPVLPYKLPKDGSLDNSTMTEEEDDNDFEIDNFIKLFPEIPIEHLRDVYEKCGNNIDWTLDILLADNKGINKDYNPPPVKERTNDNVAVEYNSTKPLVNEGAKKIRQGTSESAAAIKVSLETSVVINKEHYSEHLRKLKKMDPQVSQPCTSKVETCITNAGEVIIVDSDEEFKEVIDLSDDSDSQETMELKVGEDFISQLDTAFGDPSFLFPKGFQPVIEVPVALGRQLHALYLESVFKQLDMQNMVLKEMLKEDEEFAMKLQEQEFRNSGCEAPTPDLKQIMIEQKDISKQQKMVDQWKNLTPDDLAYKLTRQKLINNFPDADPETLVEILAAHNNCYKETIDALLESGLTEGPIIDTTAPLSETLLMDMRHAHECAQLTVDDLENKSASQLREEAWEYQRRRRDLLEKANSYYMRGMYAVALFYSELACKQTNFCEKLNNMAAEAYLSQHFKHYNTIDLHFLHVPEAIQALDRFLDNNVMLLVSEKKKTYEDLHIITGRGKNSRDGVARIKPAVLQRLRERRINSTVTVLSTLLKFYAHIAGKGRNEPSVSLKCVTAVMRFKDTSGLFLSRYMCADLKKSSKK